MDRITKFLNSLSVKDRKRVVSAVNSIGKNQLDRLDVKPMKGEKNWYRCRTGSIRIIFVRTGENQNIISDIDHRSRIYRKK